MNSDELREAEDHALRMIGETVITKAKLNIKNLNLIHPLGELWRSLNYEVDLDNHTVVVGSNKEHSMYVERGTGVNAVGGRGVNYAWRYPDYYGVYNKEGKKSDPDDKSTWLWTRGQKPKPYLQPAVEDPQVKSLVRKYSRQLGVDMVLDSLRQINEED